MGSEDKNAVRAYALAFVVKDDDCGGFLKTHILLDLCFTICDENLRLWWVLKTETIFELML